MELSVALMTSAERQDDCRIKVGDGANKEQPTDGESAVPTDNDVERRDSPPQQQSREEEEEEVPPSKMKVKEMAIRVGKKMACLPLTYATLLGIIYSLIAGRSVESFSFLTHFHTKLVLYSVYVKSLITTRVFQNPKHQSMLIALLM